MTKLENEIPPLARTLVYGAVTPFHLVSHFVPRLSVEGKLCLISKFDIEKDVERETVDRCLNTEGLFELFITITRHRIKNPLNKES
jgi:hypothetical protein